MWVVGGGGERLAWVRVWVLSGGWGLSVVGWGTVEDIGSHEGGVWVGGTSVLGELGDVAS